MSHKPQPTTRNTFQPTTRNMLFLLLLSSCAVLKNKKSEERVSKSIQQTSQVQTTALNGNKQQTRILTFADSSDHQYNAEIFPLGEFHYSSGEGFSGTASRIIIRGKLKTATAGKDSSAVNQQTEQQTTTHNRAETKNEASTSVQQKQTKHSSSSWPWLIILAGIVLFMVFKKRMSFL